MNNIVLFGIQGSGKGTQGKFIAEKYGLHVFETGGELRKLIASGSDLGNKIKTIVESGKLVDTSIIMEAIQSFLTNLPQDTPVLFDGLPRKMDQKIAFDNLMQNVDKDFLGVLIEISSDEAIKRLTARRGCKQCREIYSAFYEGETCEKCGGELEVRKDDSNLEAIENRLKAYRDETLPVIEEYKAQGKMLVINGEQAIEKVTEELLEKLEERLSN